MFAIYRFTNEIRKSSYALFETFTIIGSNKVILHKPWTYGHFITSLSKWSRVYVYWLHCTLNIQDIFVCGDCSWVLRCLALINAISYNYPHQGIFCSVESAISESGCKHTLAHWTSQIQWLARFNRLFSHALTHILCTHHTCIQWISHLKDCYLCLKNYRKWT